MWPALSPCASTFTVQALLDDPSRAVRLRAAYGDLLHTTDSQSQLLAAGREPSVELVVVPPRDCVGRSLTTTVAAIHASRRSAPVYVYADRSVECLRELMPLARAGARGIIVRDIDDDVVSLRSLLDRGSLTRALETVTLAVQQIVPTRQLPLVLLCLEHISEPASATAFAQRLHVSRRTLSGWARKTNAKGVRSLSSKCRVLTAIELLRVSGCSIEHVAHVLRFASSAHLHNTIKRYTGMVPRQAADHDVAFWCRALLMTQPSATSAS